MKKIDLLSEDGSEMESDLRELRVFRIVIDPEAEAVDEFRSKPSHSADVTEQSAAQAPIT
jgi:hypothetical protein